jgi:TP901 family phage tail tape measure protein
MAELKIDFSIDASQAAAAVKKLSADVTKLGDLLKSGKDVRVETGNADKSINALSAAYKNTKSEVSGLVDAQKQALAALAASGKTGTAEYNSLLAALKKNNDELQKIEATAKDVDKALGATSSASTLGERFASLNQTLSGFKQAADALNGLTAGFQQLDTATARIKTLGGAAKELAPEFRNVALELANTLPLAAEDIQKATYDALSAGIAPTKEAITDFITASGKLATGGAETIGNSVNILSSVLNAYGEEASKASEYSDILFTTVNLGKTSIPELTSTLSNVVPTAAAAGVSLKNVGASLSVLTANGVPTAQSTTKLNQLLIELQKPATNLAPILKKAGVSIESLKNEDLPANLGKIQKALKEAGVTATQAFSSSEAGAAFNVLTKDLSKFQGTLDSFNVSAGTTESAYQDMAGTIENQSKLMESRLGALKVRVVDSLGSFGTGAIVATKQLTSLQSEITTFASLKAIVPEGAFGSIATKAKEAGSKSAEFLKTAFEKVPLDGLKTKISDALTKLNIDPAKFSGQFGKLGETAAKALSGGLSSIGAVAFNPITLGIAAAAGALSLFFTQTEAGKKSFEQIKKVASEAFATLGKALEPLGKAFGEIFGSLASSSGGLLTALTPLLEFLGKGLAQAAQGLGAVLVAVFTGAAKAITFISSGITAVISGFQAFFTAISPVTTQIGLLVSEVGKFIAAFVSGAFNNVVGIFSAIGGAVSKVASQLGKFISETIKPVGEAFSSIGKAISGFITTLFGTSAATAQVSTNTAAIGAAAEGAAKSVLTFQQVIKFLTSSITNVRAALNGISGVLTTVGAAFAQFLEGVKTLDLSKITGAFTDLGSNVQKSFTNKWNETWNEANKTTEKATEQIKKEIDTKTKDAAELAKSNLSQPIALKLDIKKLAEDFSALQTSLQNIAETGIKGLTQNTLQVAETKEKVSALNRQLASETNADKKAALQAQLKEQKAQLAQRAAFEAEERKKAREASKEAFKNETALANEKNRTDRASILKVEKDRKNASLSILAQELEANRILETDERKRRESELADKFRIEKEKLKAELSFGDQSAAARANVNKQIIEKEKQFLNEKRKLQIEFLKQDIDNALKTAELQQKADIAALQTRLQRVITQDIQGAEERQAINKQLIEKQNAAEEQAYLNGIPQFVAALTKKKEAVSRLDGETKEKALAEIEKFQKETLAAFSSVTIDADGITVDIPIAKRLEKIKNILGLDDAAAKLALQNFDSLQNKIAREAAAKAVESQREIEAARIQTSLNFAKRDFDLRMLELERQRDRELDIAGANSALIAQAEQKFAIAALEAQGKFKIDQAESIAAREQQARLNELQKAFALEISAFEQAEKLKTEKQLQAEAIRRQIAAGGLAPEIQERAQAVLDGLNAEIATFQQNEALKLDIEREFAGKRIALLQQQMKERAGVIRLGAEQERSIYETVFSGFSSIADSFNASRNDFEAQKAALRRQKEEELRVFGATGKERLEIIKKFKQQEKEIDRKFSGGAAALALLKESTSNILSEFAAKSQSAFAQASANAKSFADLGSEAFLNLGTAAVATFGQIVVSGGDVGKALGKVAFDALQALVPILIAQITGISLAQPDSVATFGASAVARVAALTALLQGAISVARAALGFKKGGYTGDGNPNAEAGVVHKGEWVSTYETTKRERKILEFLHKGGTSNEYFERVYLPEILKKQNAAVSLQTIVAQPHFALEKLQNVTSNDIANAIAQQTRALDNRLANVESAMHRTARQFQHRSEITAHVQFDDNKYMKNIHVRQKRSALG